MPTKQSTSSSDDGTFDVYIDKKFIECGLYDENLDTVKLNYFKHSATFKKEEGCLISENYRVWMEDRIIYVPGGN